MSGRAAAVWYGTLFLIIIGLVAWRMAVGEGWFAPQPPPIIRPAPVEQLSQAPFITNASPRTPR